jgi:hypothetical protein
MERVIDFKKYFAQNAGQGYLSTASDKGLVNSAPFSRPRVLEDGSWAFGMTARQSLKNLKVNPNALYLYDAGDYRGCRASLELVKFVEEGEMLEEIRRNAERVVGPGVGSSVKCVAVFRVKNVRPLVGSAPFWA